MDRKNSFILYVDYLTQIEMLSIEQRGQLFTAILQYAAGEPVEPLPQIVDIVFSFITAQIDRDSASYQQRCETNRENAKKRYSKPVSAIACNRMQSQASESVRTVSHYDNDTDTENDTDNGNDADTFIPPTLKEIQAECDRQKYKLIGEKFFRFYSAAGWKTKTGKPIRDWKTLLKKWNDSERQSSFNQFDQRHYDFDDLEQKLLAASRNYNEKPEA